MARVVKPLSDAQIKKAKPKEKDYKLFDGGGLFLLVKKNGKKFWRQKYILDGKEKSKSFGEYPLVSLADAREKSILLKENLLHGIDPSQKLSVAEEIKENRFKKVVEQFLEFKQAELSHDYFKKVQRRFEVYVTPYIGNKEINSITKSDIVQLIKNVPNVKTVSSKQTNKAETQRIIYNLLEQVFKWAIYNDLSENDVMFKIDRNAIVSKKVVKHYKAITDEDDIRVLYKMISGYRGSLSVRNALVFLMLSGLRSVNVRFLRWEQVDFKKKLIQYSAKDMKTSREFRLPLTNEMAELLKEIEPITGTYKYVFCSMNSSSKPLSENTLGYALKRMDILNHTPHGFRSSFSTLAYEHQKEHGFSSEVIESQLAHEVGNKVKMAYMRSDFLEDRRELLQWWCSFLNNLF